MAGPRRSPKNALSQELDHPAWLGVPELWGWQDDAACGEDTMHLFFAPDNEPSTSKVIREQSAIGICEECPVRGVCRAYALAFGEQYGVWGGLDEERRKEWRRATSHRARLAVYHRAVAAWHDGHEIPVDRSGESARRHGSVRV